MREIGGKEKKNSHYKLLRVPTQGGNVSHKKWEGAFKDLIFDVNFWLLCRQPILERDLLNEDCC
jgi:hypothetical protein